MLFGIPENRRNKSKLQLTNSRFPLPGYKYMTSIESMPPINIEKYYSYVNWSICKPLKFKSIFNKVTSRDINNSKVLFEVLKSYFLVKAVGFLNNNEITNEHLVIGCKLIL